MFTFQISPISRVRIFQRSMLIFFSILLSSATFAETVVVTDSSHPFSVPSVSQPIVLDLPASLEAELSADLPSDPEKAQTIVQQRLTPDIATRLTKAHQDVATAWSLGITKIPAVVVDRQYVVYGETDFQRALDRIEQFRKAQP